MANPIRKNKLAIMAMLLMIIFALGQQGEASIRIEPARFILKVHPGERDTGAITVFNNTEQTVNLVANFYDWDLDENSDMVIYDSGTLKETLDGLIRFNPRQFILEPGQSQIVRFTVNMPETGIDEEPFERRGIIFIEHEDLFEEEEGFGATIRSMIGATIYVQPVEYEMNFAVIEMVVHETPDKQYIGGLLLGNPSLVHVRFFVNYRVISARGEEIEKGSITEKVILPGQVRPFYFFLEENFPPGDYRVLVDIGFVDTNYNISDSIPFKVSD